MWPDKTRSNNFLSPDLIGSNQIGSGLVRSRLDLVISTQIWLDLLRSDQILILWRSGQIYLDMVKST